MNPAFLVFYFFSGGSVGATPHADGSLGSLLLFFFLTGDVSAPALGGPKTDGVLPTLLLFYWFAGPPLAFSPAFARNRNIGQSFPVPQPQ